MNNIFNKLGASFGTEDFFTASVALFIERSPSFRRAFLSWLEAVTKEPLNKYAWQVGIQVAKPSRYGTAVLDMRLVNVEIELWFEHKVGAALGKYQTTAGEEADQLQKYLDSAARTMSGVTSSSSDVSWPINGPSPGQPRILLFYVSRDGTSINKDRYIQNLHLPGGCGLVWPESGQLRWREFWPLANRALENALKGECGEFERTLSIQFLNYWKGIPGMWLQDVFDEEWSKLLPLDSQILPGDKAPFDVYLAEVEHLAKAKLGWQRQANYKGTSLEFAVANGSFDHVSFGGVRRADEIDLPTANLGHEIVCLIFRARDIANVWPPPSPDLCFERWNGTAKTSRANNRTFMTIYVAVDKWSSYHTQVRRIREVTRAFVAGLKIFESITGASISGAEQL